MSIKSILPLSYTVPEYKKNMYQEWCKHALCGKIDELLDEALQETKFITELKTHADLIPSLSLLSMLIGQLDGILYSLGVLDPSVGLLIKGKIQNYQNFINNVATAVEQILKERIAI